MKVKFYITLSANGDFPGSPDKYATEISEEDHDRLWEKYFMPIAIKDGWANPNILGMRARLHRAELAAAKHVITCNHELDVSDLADKLLIKYAKESYKEYFEEAVAASMREASRKQCSPTGD